jgi:hypothetical protein
MGPQGPALIITGMQLIPLKYEIKLAFKLPIDGELLVAVREVPENGTRIIVGVNGAWHMPSDWTEPMESAVKNRRWVGGWSHVHVCFEAGNGLQQSCWLWLTNDWGRGTGLCWDIKTCLYDSTGRAIADNYAACLTGWSLQKAIEAGTHDMSAELDEQDMKSFHIYYATK